MPDARPDPRPLVWIPSPIHPLAIEKLRQLADVRCGYGDAATSFADVADEVEAILVRSGRITADQIAAAPRLKIIGRHGVGVDTVDVSAATAAGVIVTNTPTSNLVSVAEHTFALLLALRRKLTLADRCNQDGSGHTSRALLVGRELAGSTLGLIGFGRIAAQVAGIAQNGFGMRTLAYDPGLGDDEVRRRGSTPATLPHLLADSDVVSLHIPLLPDTRHLIGATELATMRPDAVIINTSRGGTIDEQALLQALDTGRLGGAALDVTEVEPLPPGHPLLNRPDVIITPHIAGQTDESLRRVALDAADDVLAALTGRPPANPVNEPPDPRILDRDRTRSAS
ncbi:hydroxyacid dehydrogenase [Pseudonocardia sp. ICBG1142]|uniref:hydroxyacid dehydrogenase n=1 Tax=Pseudonocardia sp. ICBG1142 TaxID=2846760 RepID=UPI001CF6C9E3|nr:hydroxyacid dehydrogenase [Pseudonocardia sp. ICBG1142]